MPFIFVNSINQSTNVLDPHGEYTLHVETAKHIDHYLFIHLIIDGEDLSHDVAAFIYKRGYCEWI